MKCSLIIYADEKNRTLPLLLESLKYQTEKDFEVIVAEDYRTKAHESGEQIKKENYPFKLTYIREQSRAYSREKVLNKAIVASQSDYLIFIESDSIPHKKFISDHLRLSRYGKVVAAKSINLDKDLSQQIDNELITSQKLDTYLFGKILKKSLTGKIKRGFEAVRITNGFIRHLFLEDIWQGLSSDNFSIHKEDILEANGFDERFDTKSEESDADLEFRLIQAGVYTKEESHMATLYKLWGKNNRKTSPVASFILEDNINKNISWTKYGIIKQNTEEDKK